MFKLLLLVSYERRVQVCREQPQAEQGSGSGRGSAVARAGSMPVVDATLACMCVLPRALAVSGAGGPARGPPVIPRRFPLS
jgi:hypothetical protein